MLQEIRQFLNNSQYRGIGITGGAGSGKTFLTKCLMLPSFSLDSDFIGDSSYRKNLLENKFFKSYESYLDACNMYNWWNWDKVEEHFESTLESHGRRAVLEGAILGPDSIIRKLDVILFLNIPAEQRFARLREREGSKRTFNESMHRFLITEFSENLYYAKLLNDYSGDMFFLDSDYNFTRRYKVEYNQHIPMKIRIEE